MTTTDARSPLRIPAFRYQLAAEAISVGGSTLSPVALSLGVLKLTGSAGTLGLVLGAAAVPTVVFLAVGGVWADRLPRHRLIVATNLVCAVSQATLGTMLLTGAFHLWLAIVAQILTGTALAFYFPSVSALTVQIVPEGHLQRANALLSLNRSIAGSIGPIAAGALVAASNAGVALVADGVSFLASAALLARLTVPGRSAERPMRRRFLHELAEGFHHVRRRTWVLTGIVGYMLSHLAMAFLLVLGPVILLGRDASPAAWGAVVAALGVGQLVGDLLALRIVPKRPLLLARVIEILSAPLFIVLALGGPVWILVVAAALAGVVMNLPDTFWYTALQRHLPGHVLSRVLSFDWLGSLALRPIGYLSAAACAAAIGAPATLIVAGCLVVLSRLVGLLFADVRNLTYSLTEATAAEPAHVRG
jgi:MFS family permease